MNEGNSYFREWNPVIMKNNFHKMISSLAKPLFFLVLLLMLPMYGIQAQERKVNQKKIDHDRAKKQKQAEKEYHDAVKHHKKIQSKNTKAMMRDSRKQSGSLTPVKK